MRRRVFKQRVTTSSHGVWGVTAVGDIEPLTACHVEGDLFNTRYWEQAHTTPTPLLDAHSTRPQAQLADRSPDRQKRLWRGERWPGPQGSGGTVLGEAGTKHHAWRVHRWVSFGERSMTRIGVLALQGDFREHLRALELLGVAAHPVRLPADLQHVDGLIIPGGESTVMGKLMVEYQLDLPLRNLINSGMPAWGTCAGLVLLSCETDNALADQPLLAAMDIRTRRNAFGPQRASFETDIAVPVLGDAPVHAVFIRAPAVERVGPGVEVLATLSADSNHASDETIAGGHSARSTMTETIVAVRQRNLMGTAFHPEVTTDTRFHSYFLKLVRGV
jgi:5'-phosphate synthase pdxT subunit